MKPIKIQNPFLNEKLLDIITEKYQYVLGALLCLAFILAALIFYFFAYSIQSSIAPSSDNNLRIETKLYQQAMNQLQTRDSARQEGTGKYYPDAFR